MKEEEEEPFCQVFFLCYVSTGMGSSFWVGEDVEEEEDDGFCVGCCFCTAQPD